MLMFVRLQTVGHDLATEQEQEAQRESFMVVIVGPVPISALLTFRNHQNVFKNLEVHCITVLLSELHVISQKERPRSVLSLILTQPRISTLLRTRGQKWDL